jgi:hypothetical protein
MTTERENQSFAEREYKPWHTPKDTKGTFGFKQDCKTLGAAIEVARAMANGGTRDPYTFYLAIYQRKSDGSTFTRPEGSSAFTLFGADAPNYPPTRIDGHDFFTHPYP